MNFLADTCDYSLFVVCCGVHLAVFLYYYDPGQTSFGSGGTIISLPSGEGGSEGEFNRAYNGERLVVPLTGGRTACDIGTLSIWCQPFRVDFSRAPVPRSVFLNNGEGECRLVGGNTDLPTAAPAGYDNCESFAGDTLQVSWTLDLNNSEIDIQMCGCRPLDASVNQYMAFGLSGRTDQTFMIGADATVAWVDNTAGMPSAVDYYLSHRVQCRAGEGACPDTLVTLNGSSCRDDVRTDSISGGIRNGNQQCVAFSRPFETSDSGCDKIIVPTNTRQYIVWAIGGLGETAFIHFQRSPATTPPLHLGRAPTDQCSNTPIECGTCQPFIGRSMDLPTSTTLRVHIGPAGGERGYMGITGQAGWGISWYINGTLIPELIVRRKNTYTFIVEGGIASNDVSRYHPFYISDSINGGRLQNSEQQQNMETVYAGFDEDGTPTGVGRYCEFLESTAARATRETCGSLEDYQEDLSANGVTCDPGDSGILTWTPDDNTPDVVYYQCATHLNLGWKIRVQDKNAANLADAASTPHSSALNLLFAGTLLHLTMATC